MISHSDFLQRWAKSEAAERANYQLFLSELCDFLDVPRPDPSVADDAKNLYVFERSVTRRHRDGSTSVGRIDLYRHKCFVLEAKQGSEQSPQQGSLLGTPPRIRRGTAVRGTGGWDEAMVRARFQAEGYAKDLPVEEGWPPFLVVVDVGHTIELHADFSLTGKAYIPFPDPGTHRIYLDDLKFSGVRDRLRKVWLDPLDLDPARVTAQVTRHVAEQLAELAKAMEVSHEPEKVASFLMRCIFTSFAEDVRLLPERSWTNLLESMREDVRQFQPMVEALWHTMNDGGYSPIFREHVLRFNGGLFESVEALPVTKPQLELLIRAAQAQWQDVEPAIFGTLLERALDKDERHRLGAHYTPRAYVERLVFPTVIAPLREEWQSVQTAAVALARSGKAGEAIDEIQAFRKRLCSVRVLDPACGSGNFLYVTLEHLKRLEGEVIDVLESLGDTQQTLAETGLTVDPHQLLGIELNPRAAVITDLVLWIGYLQWYFRTWGSSAMPPEPVIKRFHNVECRDAILAWDAIEPLMGVDRQPETQWDGRTMRTHPVTGEQVPDENARRQVVAYRRPRRAEWPEADFVVGNPPFIGNWRMRGELGDGYVEALRGVYSEVPESIELVSYWWHRAAELARAGKIMRFGFITTNSIRQTFNRRVLAQHLDAADPVSLIFAIPDHPWVDSTDGAAVRIAMTTAEAGKREGLLCRVTSEVALGEEGALVTLSERAGVIHGDLTIGPNISGAEPMVANQGLSCRGVVLHGAGFLVSRQKAVELGLGRIGGLESHIRPYCNGRDIAGRSRNLMVIDLLGLEAADVRDRFPEVYQHLLDFVKPERDQNNRAARRDRWWLFGETISTFRPALRSVSRFIATVETAKHRFFMFLDASILPDNMLVNIASEDAYVLGVLSSRIHVAWALAAGGRLGVGNDPRYNKSRCFEPFPFPAATDTQQSRIRALGEALDGHRKRRQELHPALTMTQMYNVLEKLRAGEVLSAEDRRIHEQGLVSALRTIHDDLDVAVTEAYGWPIGEEPEEILFRLVALNAERAAEEKQGIVRYLRPEFQCLGHAAQTGFLPSGSATATEAVRRERRAWPTSLPERVRAIREALAAQAAPVTAEVLAKEFLRARVAELSGILETLVLLGQARQSGNQFQL
jgi:hypothetical protein